MGSRRCFRTSAQRHRAFGFWSKEKGVFLNGERPGERGPLLSSPELEPQRIGREARIDKKVAALGPPLALARRMVHLRVVAGLVQPADPAGMVGAQEQHR